MAVNLLALSEGNLDCPLLIEIDGKYKYVTCREIISPLSWEYTRAYGFYERSLLPNGISWIKESNKFIQAMMILDNECKKVNSKVPKDGKRTRS